MQILYNIFNTILDAGAVVMLPIIITIIGLIFRVKLSKAFRSGLTIGIGFAGINLVINMMKSNLGPAAQAMVQNFGIKLAGEPSRQLHGHRRLSLSLYSVFWPPTLLCWY